MRRILILALLLIAAGASAQNQYYVSTSGSDSNNGTSPATPWRHISKAIATFSLNPSTGAQINVHAGTYSDENIACGGYSAAVCISRGGSSSAVRLKLVCDTQWSVPSGSGCLLRSSDSDPGGSDTGIVVSTANNVDVGAINQFGFDYSNTNYAYGIQETCNLPNNSAPGFCSIGNSIHVLGNYLHDLSSAIPTCEVNPNGHPALIMSNHHGPTVTDLQIIGNRISNVGNQSLSALNGGPGCNNYYGMYINGQASVIENNVVTNVAGYDLQYYGSPCQGTISNNTLSRSEKPNIVIGGGDCGNGIPVGSITVDNNILGQTAAADHIQLGTLGGGSPPCSSSHPILLSNNLFRNDATQQVLYNSSTTQACTAVQNSKVEAPTSTFVNYTGGNNDDFHLKAGSIAIGGGTINCVSGGLTPCVPLLDFSAVTRSNPLSIGAYDVAGGGGGGSTGSVSPSSLNFGTIAVSSCSSPQTSTFTNTGASTIVFGGNSITGTNPGDFTFGGIGTCGSSLAPGASCTYSSKFCPIAAGARTAFETIPSNASNSPQNIALAGTGGVPIVSLSPTSLSFGNQQVGTTSATQTVTLTNTGTGTLTNIVVTLQ